MERNTIGSPGFRSRTSGPSRNHPRRAVHVEDGRVRLKFLDRFNKRPAVIHSDNIEFAAHQGSQRIQDYVVIVRQ